MEMITISMDVRTAAAVRQSLFTDTKMYTYDPKSVPPRVSDIRSVIQDLDDQIELELEEDSNS
jgi:hypothetical protein|tara:strand:+ start:900 stop:1088 length:189 start_codon:yes stop_codon:yes gene_type:complete